ncbi:MAG: proline dipeptidase [Clostridiaceae bacterium]|nr:MAG: proline dipeptidase [Clostridiaceae bacterium]
MKLLNESLIIEKKSKFIGMLYEIDNKEDVLSILDSVKTNNKGYRHIPYAYYLKNTASKSDDKEPGGIGMSFLNILERNKLDNHLLLVVRYYGGTKLGASNLLRTYSKAANNCINKD